MAMEKVDTKQYWEYRGDLSFKFKGEFFYTITPVPFYYYRRMLLMTLLSSVIDSPSIFKVLDFGCGDGWYLKNLSQKIHNKKWYGVDLSESMIARAQSICPHATLSVLPVGANLNGDFDLIYCVAVFAHIVDDNKLQELFKNIYDSLKPGGLFIIFEQTGPRRISGDNWCRRTYNDYLKLAAHCGMLCSTSTLIAFPAHRFFEKLICPFYYRFIAKGKNASERCINSNRSSIFRAISSFMIKISGFPLRSGGGNFEGNTFYVFER